MFIKILSSHTRGLRLLAMSVVFCFLASDLHVFAQPLTSLTQSANIPEQLQTIRSESRSSQSLFEPKAIRIPETFGLIKETYRGDSDRIVLILQDAHGHLSAQYSLVNLLEHAQTKYGFDAVFLEGGLEGEITKDQLRFFENDSLNEELATDLLKEAKIGGPSLYLLKHPEKMRVYGIESKELYYRNILSFRRVYSWKHKTDKFLNQLKSRIQTVASQVFNPALHAFSKEWLFYQDDQHDILQHLEILERNAKKHLRISFKDAKQQLDYPHLVRYFHLRSLEKQMRAPTFRGAIEREKEKLLNMMWDLPLESSHSEFLKLITLAGTQMKKKDIPKRTRYVLEAFYEQAHRGGFRWEEYPHLNQFLSSIILGQEIDGYELFTEIELATNELMEVLTETADEQEVLDMYRGYFLLHKLLSLELTREEFLKVETEVKQHRPVTFLERLQNYHFSEKKFAYIADTEKVFREALQFYDLAITREDRMMNSMLEILEREGHKKVLMVSGGFHAEGITAYLKQNDVSYLSILPHIDKLDPNTNYVDQMMLRTKIDPRFSRVVQIGADRILVPEMMRRDQSHQRRILRSAIRKFDPDGIHDHGPAVKAHDLLKSEPELGIAASETRVLQTRTAPHDQFQGLDLGKAMTFVKQAMQNGGRDRYPTLTPNELNSEIPEGERMNTLQNRVDENQALHNMLKNSQDWNYDQNGDLVQIEKHSRVHGEGALGFLGELRGRKSFAVMESKRKGARGIRVYFWNVGSKESAKYRFYFEYADDLDFEHGTRHEIHKTLDDVEDRVENIRARVAANVLSPVIVNDERANPTSNDNKLEKYDYLGRPNGNQVAFTNPVTVEIGRNGYSVQDSGYGLSDQDFFERYLVAGINEQDRNALRQAQQRDPRDGKLKSSKQRARRTQVEGWVNSHQVSVFRHSGSEKLNLVEQLIVDFPPGTTIPNDSSVVMLDNLSRHAIRTVIDRLTDPKANIENRFAKINSLATYIRAKQTEQELEQLPERERLLEYLAKQVAQLIEALQEGGLIDGKVVVPNDINTPGEQVFDHDSFIPLDRELFQYDFNTLVRHRLRSPTLEMTEQLIGDNDVINSVHIYLTDWPLSEQLGGQMATWIYDDDGVPVILVDGTVVSEQNQTLATLSMMLGMWAPELKKILNEKDRRITPVRKKQVRQKRGLLDSLHRFRGWIGGAILVLLSLPIFQGLADKYQEWKTSNALRQQRQAAILNDNGFQAQQAVKDDQEKMGSSDPSEVFAPRSSSGNVRTGPSDRIRWETFQRPQRRSPPKPSEVEIEEVRKATRAPRRPAPERPGRPVFNTPSSWRPQNTAPQTTRPDSENERSNMNLPSRSVDPGYRSGGIGVGGGGGGLKINHRSPFVFRPSSSAMSRPIPKSSGGGTGFRPGGQGNQGGQGGQQAPEEDPVYGYVVNPQLDESGNPEMVFISIYSGLTEDGSWDYHEGYRKWPKEGAVPLETKPISIRMWGDVSPGDFHLYNYHSGIIKNIRVRVIDRETGRVKGDATGWAQYEQQDVITFDAGSKPDEVYVVVYDVDYYDPADIEDNLGFKKLPQKEKDDFQKYFGHLFVGWDQMSESEQVEKAVSFIHTVAAYDEYANIRHGALALAGRDTWSLAMFESLLVEGNIRGETPAEAIDAALAVGNEIDLICNNACVATALTLGQEDAFTVAYASGIRPEGNGALSTETIGHAVSLIKSDRPGSHRRVLDMTNYLNVNQTVEPAPARRSEIQPTGGGLAGTVVRATQDASDAYRALISKLETMRDEGKLDEEEVEDAIDTLNDIWADRWTTETGLKELYSFLNKLRNDRTVGTEASDVISKVANFSWRLRSLMGTGHITTDEELKAAEENQRVDNHKRTLQLFEEVRVTGIVADDAMLNAIETFKKIDDKFYHSVPELDIYRLIQLFEELLNYPDYRDRAQQSYDQLLHQNYKIRNVYDSRAIGELIDNLETLVQKGALTAEDADGIHGWLVGRWQGYGGSLNQAEKDALKAWVEILATDDEFGEKIEADSRVLLGKSLKDLRELQHIWDLSARLREIQAEGQLPAEDLQLLINILDAWKWGDDYEVYDREQRQNVSFDPDTVFNLLRDFIETDNYVQEFYEYLNLLALKSDEARERWVNDPNLYNIPLLVQKLIEALDGVMSEQDVLEKLDLLFDADYRDTASFTEGLKLLERLNQLDRFGEDNESKIAAFNSSLETIVSVREKWIVLQRLNDIKAENTLPPRAMDAVIEMWTDRIGDDENAHYTNEQIYNILRRFLEQGQHPDVFYYLLNDYASRNNSVRNSYWQDDVRVEDMPYLINQIVITLRGSVADLDIREFMEQFLTASNNDKSSLQRILVLNYELKAERSYQTPKEFYEKFVEDVNEEIKSWEHLGKMRAIQDEGFEREELLEPVIAYLESVVKGESSYYGDDDKREAAFAALRELSQGDVHRNDFYEVMDTIATESYKGKALWHESALPGDIPFVVRKIIEELDGIVSEDNVLDYVDRYRMNRSDDQSSIRAFIDLRLKLDGISDPKEKNYEFRRNTTALSRIEWDAFEDAAAPYFFAAALTAVGLIILGATYFSTKKAIEEENEDKREKKLYPGHKGPEERNIGEPEVPRLRQPDDEVEEGRNYAGIQSEYDTAVTTIGTFYELGPGGVWQEVESSYRVTDKKTRRSKITVATRQPVREDRTIELIGYMDTIIPDNRAIHVWPAKKKGKIDYDGPHLKYSRASATGEVTVVNLDGTTHTATFKDGRIVLPEDFPSDYAEIGYPLSVTDAQDLVYHTHTLSSLPSEDQEDFGKYFQKELNPHLEKGDLEKLDALDAFMSQYVVLDESVTEDSPNHLVRENHHTSWAHAIHEHVHRRGRKIHANSRIVVFIKALAASYLGMPVMKVTEVDKLQSSRSREWKINTSTSEDDVLLIGVHIPKTDEESAKSETRSTDESSETPENEQEVDPVLSTIDQIKATRRTVIAKGSLAEGADPEVIWVADPSLKSLNPGKPTVGEITKRVWTHNLVPAFAWTMRFLWNVITLKWAIEIARRVKLYFAARTQYRRNRELTAAILNRLGIPATSPTRKFLERYPKLVLRTSSWDALRGDAPRFSFAFLEGLDPNRVIAVPNYDLLIRMLEYHRSQNETEAETAFLNTLFRVWDNKENGYFTLKRGHTYAPTLEYHFLKTDYFSRFDESNTFLYKLRETNFMDRILGLESYKLDSGGGKMLKPIDKVSPVDLYISTHLPLTNDARTYGEQILAMALNQNKMGDVAPIFKLVSDINAMSQDYCDAGCGGFNQGEWVLQDPQAVTTRLLRQAFFELQENHTLEGTLDLVDYLNHAPTIDRDRQAPSPPSDSRNPRLYQLYRFSRKNDPWLDKIFPHPQRELVEDLLGRDSLREEDDDNATLDSDLELHGSLLDHPEMQARFRRQKPSLAWVIDAAREIASREKEMEDRGEIPQPLTYEAFLDAMIAVTQERGDPRSRAEMLQAIENQSQPGMVMIRELIQNARDVTRDVPENKVHTELARFHGKREVRVRSYLNNKHPDGKMRHIMSVEDGVGMLPDILVKVFFPPKATTKSPDKVIGKILALPMPEAEKVDLIFKGLVLKDKQNDQGLRGEVEAIVRAARTQDTVDNILITLEDVIDPEKKKAGQFGVGNYTVHQHSDEVVVRTGYGEKVYLVKMEVKRSTRRNEAGETEEFIDDIEVQDFKVYRDPKKAYKGTLVQSIRVVEGRDRAQIEHEDRYLKYLFAKYVGAVTDVDIKFMRASGRVQEGVSVKDKREKIAGHGAVWTTNSSLKIPRVTVDELYIQDPVDDQVLFAGVPAWGRAWIKSVHLNFEYRRGTSVKEARAGIRYAKELSPDTAAAALKSFVVAFRQGGIKIPELHDYDHSTLIQDPNAFFQRGLADPQIAADAGKINRGENLSPQRWKYYMEDDPEGSEGLRLTANQKYTALLMRVEVTMADGVARSLLDEKNHFFFRHVPSWMRQQFFVNSRFRDQFTEIARPLGWSIADENSPKRNAQAMFETTAKLYAENGLATAGEAQPGFPGHPYSFESYLSTDVPKVVPSAEVDEQLGKITPDIDFGIVLASEEATASYLMETVINQGRTINDIKDDYAGSSNTSLEDAISQATNVYLVRPDQSGLIGALDTFLTTVSTAIREQIPAEEQGLFRFDTEWNLSDENTEPLDAFQNFIVSGDQSILAHVLEHMSRGDAQGRSNSFFSAVMNAQSSGSLNLSELQQTLNTGQNWDQERQTLNNIIQTQSQQNLETHFIHGRSETRDLQPENQIIADAPVVESPRTPSNSVQEDRRSLVPDEQQIETEPVSISFETQLDVARAIQKIMGLEARSEVRKQLFDALWPDRLENIQLSDNALRLQSAIAFSDEPITIVSAVPEVLADDEMEQYVTGVLTALFQNNLTHEVLTVVNGSDRTFRRAFEKSWSEKVSAIGLASAEARRMLRHAPIMSSNRASLLGAALLSGRQVVLVGPSSFTWDLQADGISYDRVFTDQLPDGTLTGLDAVKSRKLLGSFVTSALETVLLEPDFLSEKTRLLIEAKDQLWYIESVQAILSFAGELDALFETIRSVRKSA